LDGLRGLEHAVWVYVDLLLCPVCTGERIIRRVSSEKGVVGPERDCKSVALPMVSVNGLGSKSEKNIQLSSRRSMKTARPSQTIQG
jgi:hypothetical protein